MSQLFDSSEQRRVDSIRVEFSSSVIQFPRISVRSESERHRVVGQSSDVDSRRDNRFCADNQAIDTNSRRTIFGTNTNVVYTIGRNSEVASNAFPSSAVREDVAIEAFSHSIAIRSRSNTHREFSIVVRAPFNSIDRDRIVNASFQANSAEHPSTIRRVDHSHFRASFSVNIVIFPSVVVVNAHAFAYFEAIRTRVVVNQAAHESIISFVFVEVFYEDARFSDFGSRAESAERHRIAAPSRDLTSGITSAHINIVFIVRSKASEAIYSTFNRVDDSAFSSRIETFSAINDIEDSDSFVRDSDTSSVDNNRIHVEFSDDIDRRFFTNPKVIERLIVTVVSYGFEDNIFASIVGSIEVDFVLVHTLSRNSRYAKDTFVARFRSQTRDERQQFRLFGNSRSFAEVNAETFASIRSTRSTAECKEFDTIVSIIFEHELRSNEDSFRARRFVSPVGSISTFVNILFRVVFFPNEVDITSSIFHIPADRRELVFEAFEVREIRESFTFSLHVERESNLFATVSLVAVSSNSTSHFVSSRRIEVFDSERIVRSEDRVRFNNSFASEDLVFYHPLRSTFGSFPFHRHRSSSDVSVIDCDVAHFAASRSRVNLDVVEV